MGSGVAQALPDGGCIPLSPNPPPHHIAFNLVSHPSRPASLRPPEWSSWFISSRLSTDSGRTVHPLSKWRVVEMTLSASRRQKGVWPGGHWGSGPELHFLSSQRPFQGTPRCQGIHFEHLVQTLPRAGGEKEARRGCPPCSRSRGEPGAQLRPGLPGIRGVCPLCPLHCGASTEPGRAALCKCHGAETGASNSLSRQRDCHSRPSPPLLSSPR